MGKKTFPWHIVDVAVCVAACALFVYFASRLPALRPIETDVKFEDLSETDITSQDMTYLDENRVNKSYVQQMAKVFGDVSWETYLEEDRRVACGGFDKLCQLINANNLYLLDEEQNVYISSDYNALGVSIGEVGLDATVDDFYRMNLSNRAGNPIGYSLLMAVAKSQPVQIENAADAADVLLSNVKKVSVQYHGTGLFFVVVLFCNLVLFLYILYRYFSLHNLERNVTLQIVCVATGLACLFALVVYPYISVRRIQLNARETNEYRLSEQVATLDELLNDLDQIQSRDERKLSIKESLKKECVSSAELIAFLISNYPIGDFAVIKENGAVSSGALQRLCSVVDAKEISVLDHRDLLADNAECLYEYILEDPGENIVRVGVPIDLYYYDCGDGPVYVSPSEYMSNASEAATGASISDAEEYVFDEKKLHDILKILPSDSLTLPENEGEVLVQLPANVFPDDENTELLPTPDDYHKMDGTLLITRTIGQIEQYVLPTVSNDYDVSTDNIVPLMQIVPDIFKMLILAFCLLTFLAFFLANVGYEREI